MTQHTHRVVNLWLDKVTRFYVIQYIGFIRPSYHCSIEIFSSNQLFNTQYSQKCGIETFTLTLFWAKISWKQYRYLLKKSLNSCFDEIFLIESNVEKREILYHEIILSSNQITVQFFSQPLIWRKFCEKKVAVKFSNFHTALWHNHDFYVRTVFDI